MAVIDHQSAQAAYVRRQIKMAQNRLAAINNELTRGHDVRLVAESELLNLQLSSLRLELKG